MVSNWLINVIIVLHWALLVCEAGTHCDEECFQELIKTSPVILKALGAKVFADVDIRRAASSQIEKDTDNNVTAQIVPFLPASSSALITLTPSTIYKGASLLKIAPTIDGDEYYHYDGQINATVDSISCNETTEDNRILDILPTELIVFGKLDSEQSDVLRINRNGLHAWTAIFENRIWKHLGWDDWSDFTACSVMCDKGVQQRFRRCLLDSPNAGVSRLGSRVEYYHPQAPALRINSVDRNNKRNHKNYEVSSRLKKLKRKKGKVLSTQSCEGYNIEQRNCNAFECSDEITDLLKFSKKPPTEGGPFSQTRSTSTTQQSVLNSTALQTSKTEMVFPGWRGLLNFTIMMTLKVKSKSQSRLFSLRNSTHNLYLEQSPGPDGLKLFLERNDVTEMLPIKLDLYDDRWHQIAISVHNGDFITIYVDCLWMDSFIVSKGLFALPDAGDVAVGGPNFSGDFQQLIILPGNHEKTQCSSARTPINEVKRYIINTFIADDGN